MDRLLDAITILRLCRNWSGGHARNHRLFLFRRRLKQAAMSEICNAHTHLDLSDQGRVCPKIPVGFVHWMSRSVWNLWRRDEAARHAAVLQGIEELKAGARRMFMTSPILGRASSPCCN